MEHKINLNYTSKIIIIVPTYNEVNINEQEYPRNKLEIIVIDSASIDRTSEKVKQGAMRHSDLNLKLIREPERKGKAYVLNTALNTQPKKQ